MISLSLEKAHKYVLQALDELKNLEGGIMLGETEDLDTMKLTEGYIVEAALMAHRDAPPHLVEGEIGVKGTDYEVEFDTEDPTIAKITMTTPIARLASLKASDSPYVIEEAIPEGSPIARMQNNKYVRGTYDDPRLIVKSVWNEPYCPEYLYYSVKSNSATFSIEYVPYPEISGDAVQISSKLEYAVLALLVSMVLDSLPYVDKGNIYKAKYQEYLKG